MSSQDATADTSQAWAQIAASKRAALLASIPNEWIVPQKLLPPESQDDVTGWPEASGWFTAQELHITGLNATELLQKLASGELSSVDVTKAFCKRASAAQQLTNCLTETCFSRALETAQARDDHFAKTGKPVGAFHGLPISLKDNFNLRGLDSTIGFVSHVQHPAASDSTLVTMLEDAGAVVYTKTNVPTAMMIAESVNNVFGRTVNPLNRKTTSGGSSGGESALIALGGSPLGVGTDIGGSLRIPAACTGIFSLRPSFGRFPVRDCRSGMAGQEAVNAVNGPLARSIHDIELYSKTVVDAKPWLHDAKCLPIPWRVTELPSKLKIAVLWHDDMVLPTPPVARALRETVDKLKSAGHEVVEWDPVDQKAGLELIGRMFVADGGKSIRQEFERSGEPLRPEMAQFQSVKELGTYEMWQLQSERSAFQNKYLERWVKSGIDAILCPVMPFNNVENGKFQHIAYTGIFNVVDYPCLSFPTGLTVDKDTDRVGDDYKSLSPTCQTLHDEYKPELMHGLPINLQLATSRLEEEKLIAVCHVVLDALSK